MSTFERLIPNEWRDGIDVLGAGVLDEARDDQPIVQTSSPAPWTGSPGGRAAPGEYVPGEQAQLVA